jgi:hypothetical protein
MLRALKKFQFRDSEVKEIDRYAQEGPLTFGEIPERVRLSKLRCWTTRSAKDITEPSRKL